MPQTLSPQRRSLQAGVVAHFAYVIRDVPIRLSRFGELNSIHHPSAYLPRGHNKNTESYGLV